MLDHVSYRSEWLEFNAAGKLGELSHPSEHGAGVLTHQLPSDLMWALLSGGVHVHTVPGHHVQGQRDFHGGRESPPHRDGRVRRLRRENRTKQGDYLFPTHSCMCACSVTQWCPTLCDPMDCSPPGSSAHGSVLPYPPPGDLPDPGIEPGSPVAPALAGGFHYQWTTWKALPHPCPDANGKS